MVLNKIFNYLGVECIEAANGKEGMEELDSRNDIGLILLDLNMPIVDGYDFLKWYNSTKYKIPIYIISGSSQETFQTTIKNQSINTPFVIGFMHKPVDMAKLKNLSDSYFK
jgi:CheY-like chemotaxis protein